MIYKKIHIVIFQYLFITLFLISTLNAQEKIIPLYENEIPNFQKTDEVEIVKIKETHYSISYVQEPTITVYSPARANSTKEAVIIAPGGGYHGLAYDWEGLDVAKWLNANGITGIVLKYRLPISKSNIIPHKTPLLDIQRAIRMARANAEEWRIDSDKIGVMGFSAGGHLASTAGTHFDNGNKTSEDPIEQQSSRPDFMILVYPVISFTADCTHKVSKKALLGENPSDSLVQLFSNELQVTEDTPPTILFHSADDKGVTVENSLLFFDALRKKNISAELHIYPYGGHGFAFARGKGRLSKWPEICIDWIRELE
ncbi:MAG: alpha/beta hydrolase [Melioribacteraceae bacterium]|nr:alpha/beta hydrolase [Melioribacteraceae bacterium]